MERLILKYKDAKDALMTLINIFNEPYSIIVRDATIQRFEYTFEAFWKFTQEYLKVKEGIIANSPKMCFREMFSLGFCEEEETIKLLEMTDKRNETSHTYKEKVAQSIYDTVKDFSKLMDKILNSFEEKINS